MPTQRTIPDSQKRQSRPETKKSGSRRAKKKSAVLSRINSPADLRGLSLSSLSGVAAELREFMLEKVSESGGHVAPSLGAVELALALHYCYDTPRDKLIWDVGHQAYAHKILTGRRDAFDTLRRTDGISGFPRVCESDYDTVSVGHASTSISVGLGIAMARDIQKKDFHVVSVIGDGSLSGGLALEGLNNLGTHSTRMTVILNDNKMSISKNVGALARYLTRVLTDKRFHRLKGQVWELLGNMSPVGKRIRSLVHDIDDTLKHIVIPGKLFEDMGLQYYGPVDGHNITEMVEVFRFLRDSVDRPALVHVITTKGKGYPFAEKNATKFHGISGFSRRTGVVVAAPSKAPSYSRIFGETLTELARTRNDLVAITAAMPDGTGLACFRETYPERFFDVGIAEEHAVTFAAGLALQGMRPIVALYSTFLQRAYDQIMHDVALDHLHVVFCIDRAGLVGEDGPTHHGMFDLSFLRTIPGITIMAPSDENELGNMLLTALEVCRGPVCIRYPRGSATGADPEKPEELPVPLPRIIAEGKDNCIIAAGTALHKAQKVRDSLAKDGISCGLVDARFIKPLDRDTYLRLFNAHSRIVTLEHNSLTGGFGSGLLELANSLPEIATPHILPLGYPDQFIEHGDLATLDIRLGLDVENLTRRVRTFFTQ